MHYWFRKSRWYLYQWILIWIDIDVIIKWIVKASELIMVVKFTKKTVEILDGFI
jgi:hypothetical protein